MFPEGTHYADYLWALTDFPITSDYSLSRLGNYIIYNNNTVFKIISDQNFLPFVYLPPNHVETLVCKDNRLTFSGGVLSIPVPEIDGQYAPLFELITMVNQCFTAPPITTIWAYQQELQPLFPYCAVSIERLENIENTNYVNLDLQSSTLTTNISQQLIVEFDFLALDMIQALNLAGQFKLNYVNYNFTTLQFGFMGFIDDKFVSDQSEVVKTLYEDRTIFKTKVKMRFSYITEQTSTSTQSIDTVLFTLSIPPVS